MFQQHCERGRERAGTRTGKMKSQIHMETEKRGGTEKRIGVEVRGDCNHEKNDTNERDQLIPVIC